MCVMYVFNIKIQFPYIGLPPDNHANPSIRYAGNQWRRILLSVLNVLEDVTLPSGYQVTSEKGCFLMYLKHNRINSFQVIGVR